MKAYILHGIGDFVLEQRERPVVQPREVMVKVKAAGICGSDIPRIYKTGAYHHPMTPGHEFSGKVVETGSQVTGNWQGKRVGIFPLIPCMECSSCQKKKYEMCKNYSYLGSRTDGGFAEYVRVPEWNLIELPEKVSYEQAAMLEPMAVAVHAIRNSRLLECCEATEQSAYRKSVVVWGMGTIGMFVVMFLKNLGFENILVVGNKDFQKKMVSVLGIDESNFCDVRCDNPSDWFSEKTQEEGIDYFFECVGKKEVLTQGIDSIAAGGTVVLVGNPASNMDIEKTTYWKLLRRQVTVQGTWNSSFMHCEQDDWHFVLDLLAKGEIQPEQMITHQFDMEELLKGFELMRDKSEDYIKVMGVFGDEK